MTLDPRSLIETFGYIGIFLIVYAESGVLLGFFLPGDSLLFTAGILASQKLLTLPLVIVLIITAALAGDNTGYYLGRRFGPKLFSRPDAKLLNPAYIAKSKNFYERFGGKTLVLARYIPIVRTFAPPLAGMARMPYGTFLTYDLVGCSLWGIGITTLGYYLGKSIPNIDKYLLPGIAIIILLSISPALLHLLKNREDRRRLVSGLKNLLKRE